MVTAEEIFISYIKMVQEFLPNLIKIKQNKKNLTYRVSAGLFYNTIKKQFSFLTNNFS